MRKPIIFLSSIFAMVIATNAMAWSGTATYMSVKTDDGWFGTTNISHPNSTSDHAANYGSISAVENHEDVISSTVKIEFNSYYGYNNREWWYSIDPGWRICSFTDTCKETTETGPNYYKMYKIWYKSNEGANHDGNVGLLHYQQYISIRYQEFYPMGVMW